MRARSITSFPTLRPIAAPASLSIGKWMPAQSREFFASSAQADNSAASPGKRWPSTVAAAADMVEWPEV